MTEAVKMAVGTTPVSRRYCVGVAVGAAALSPGVVIAGADAYSAEWAEMVRVCEAVFAEQTDAPLSGYAPAPFTSGKPEMKKFSVYAPPRELVAIARVENEAGWSRCTVRRFDELRSDKAALRSGWREWFASTFPRTDYRWSEWLVRPDRMAPFALRCDGSAFRHAVYGTIETDFHLRVIVSAEADRLFSTTDPCHTGDDDA